jgi:hypothetical protein
MIPGLPQQFEKGNAMAEESKGANVKAVASVNKPPVEDVYPIQELIQAAKTVFDTRPEVVRAALRKVKKTEMSVAEAKRMIDAFKAREVE